MTTLSATASTLDILSTKQWQEGDRLLGLLPHHVTVLRARGISDETAIAANLHTEADKIKLASILDRKRARSSPRPSSFRIRHRRPERLRPRQARQSAANRTRNRSSTKVPRPAEPGLLPARRGGTGGRHRAGHHRLRRRVQGPSRDTARFPVHRSGGSVRLGEKNKEALLPEMEHIPWQGRQVYIAYDSDITDKPDVQDAEARLAAHLTNRGAIVKVVRIPAGPPDANGKPTKLGLDDYLVSQDDPKKACGNCSTRPKIHPRQSRFASSIRPAKSTRLGKARHSSRAPRRRWIATAPILAWSLVLLAGRRIS